MSTRFSIKGFLHVALFFAILPISCSPNNSGQLGPVCAAYLGQMGCCRKAAGSDAAADAACDAAATTYASAPDQAQAEHACQAAQDAADAAGLCSPMSSGGPSALCQSYLACVSKVAADMFPAALGSYGPSSQCWRSATLGAQCSTACKGQLDNLRLLPTAATVPECLSCASNADCGGALPACGTAAHLCKAGCVIQGAVVLEGATDPMNSCLSCQPYVSATSFSPIKDGSSCGGGHICMSHQCVPSFTSQISNTTQKLLAVWGSGPNDVYAAGEYGTILHTANLGANWTRIAGGTPGHMNGIWGSSSTDVFAADSVGNVWHSTDGGASWTSKAVARSFSELTTIWGSSSTDVYTAASSDFGQVFHSSDDGMTFPGKTVAGGISFIWGSSKSDVYGLGLNGIISHSADNGQSWQSTTTSGSYTLRGMWGSSSTNVYVVGDNGAGQSLILHSTDGGKAWAPTFPSEPRLLAVWGSGSSEVYAVGENGAILFTKDSGVTWVPLAAGTKNTLRGVWGSDSQNVYIVGDAGTILGLRH